MADPYGPPPGLRPAEPLERPEQPDSASDPGDPGDPGLRAGLAQALQEQFSFEKAFGGTRGVLESIAPYMVFSVVFPFNRDITVAAIAALLPAVFFLGWRLVAREPLTQAISGLLGLGLGAFIALRTGKAEAFFLPSIIKNAGYAAGYLLSIVVRWPIVGLLLGLMLAEGTHWRRTPARMRVYVLATWLWCGMFALRFGIQLPLYLTDRPATLALVNIGLGPPLFGLVVWGTWLIVSRVPPARPEQSGVLPRPKLPDSGAYADTSRPTVDRPVPES